ncbi:hypothetical protein EQ500_12145, partial [Lactobacillus sp. XV13L]|nr:hypothetical protein [Lactobacillus sp. XV13L]
MTNSQKAFIKYQLKYLAAYEFGIICLFFLFAFIFGNYSLADFNSSFNNLLFFAPFVTFHWLDQESFKLSLQYSLSRKFYIMMILLSAIISAVVVYGIILIIGLILQNLHAGVQTLGHFMVLT